MEGAGSKGMSRRALLASAGGVAAMLALGGLRAVPAQAQVRPPGGQDEGAMLARCVRCQRCVEACPRGVIRPARIEDGIVGARMPRLSFDRDWCDWCEQENGGVPLCVQACGSLALELAPQAARESTVMGIAEIDASQCLAHRQMNCRRCYDACPYGAMELDAAGRPVVVEELCTGCGACEAACVSLVNASVGTEIERRAITVQPAELGIGGRS